MTILIGFLVILGLIFIYVTGFSSGYSAAGDKFKKERQELVAKADALAEQLDKFAEEADTT